MTDSRRESTADGTHSTDLATKTAHRAAALAHTADTGTLYVPYCGFGECATAAEYPMGRVVGCDTDRAAVEHWNAAWPHAEIHLGNAHTFHRWGDDEIVYADIDAFGAPWRTLERLLRNGPCADEMQVVCTDGSEQKRQRAKTPYNFRTHKFEQMHSVDAAAQSQDIESHVVAWLDRLGWDATVSAHDRTAMMLYWWLTLTRRDDAVRDRPVVAMPSAEPDPAAVFTPPIVVVPVTPTGRQTKLNAEVQETICRMIAEEGTTHEVACREAGVSVSSFYTWVRKGRAAKRGVFYRFVQALDDATATWHRKAVGTLYQAGVEGYMKTRTKHTQQPDGTVVTEVTTETVRDLRWLAWLLARRFPDLYSERIVTEGHLTVGSSDQPLVVNFVDPPDFENVIEAEVVEDGPPALT